MQKYHDEPKQYKGYLKSALAEEIDIFFWAGADEKRFHIGRLRIDPWTLEDAVIADRRNANLGASLSDFQAVFQKGENPFPIDYQKLSDAVYWAAIEETWSPVREAFDDQLFLEKLQQDGGTELFRSESFRVRLQGWLENRNTAMLEALGRALKKIGGIRRGRRTRTADPKALDRAREMWPEVAAGVRTFWRSWRGLEEWEYRAAVRQELVERFLPDASSDLQDACVKRLCNPRPGALDKAITLVSAATGLTKHDVREFVAPLASRTHPDISD